jgi:hypothetical protein
MSRTFKYGVCMLLAFGLALAPSMTSAGGKLRFGVSAFGGYAKYQMTDLNKQVGSTIDAIDRAIGSSTDKFLIDDIGQGAEVDGGLQAWLTNNIVVASAYERLFAKTTNDGAVLGKPYHAESSVPADAVTVTGAYFIPSASRFRIGFGAGLGYYWTKAKIELSSNGAPITDTDLGLGSTGAPVLSSEVKGHGIGFHALAAADFAAMGPVHVNLQIGARVAKTTRLEDTATGGEFKDAGGGKVNADWSGPFVRAGLTVLLGRAD